MWVVESSWSSRAQAELWFPLGHWILTLIGNALGCAGAAMGSCRNTVVVIRVQDPIIRLIFQNRIALLLAFACWLDVSFRLDGTISSAAAVRCSLIQGRVFILKSLGGIFSLPLQPP